MYCNDMQMANITFDGVRDAIMAEFEHTARPAQLAHQADKISAVKRKGQSPHLKEQRKKNSAPHLATEAPYGESSVKRTRKGGKWEKAHKAKAAHNIVSSAFVPVTVLNHMQESHYMEAGPSTSRVEEVVEQHAPTPVTVIGGPSWAPIRSAAPVSIASIRPSSITYLKAVTLPMQSMTGLSSLKAPFNMEKEHMLLKKVGVWPTVEPLCAMHKLVEEQDEAMDQVLGKHRKFMEFAKNSPPVQNTVASSSMLPEKPVKPLLQDSLPPAPTFKTMKEYDEHEKRHRNRTKKAKKAKKDVHPAPSEMETNSNICVFPEVSSNLVSESGEPLFLEENLKVFPNSPFIINPKHPCAPYFKALIESLNLDGDEGNLNDPSLDINHCTDKLSQVEYKEPLDWGTDSTQDNQFSDEDSISNELAATAGISYLSLTPAPSRQSSHAPSNRLSKGKQREVRRFGGDDQDNNWIAMHMTIMATIG
jgi:hypothetical protein